jgi:hypothetical protein
MQTRSMKSSSARAAAVRPVQVIPRGQPLAARLYTGVIPQWLQIGLEQHVIRLYLACNWDFRPQSPDNSHRSIVLSGSSGKAQA